jgi:thiamine-phosphate pyrophosphorylase
MSEMRHTGMPAALDRRFDPRLYLVTERSMMRRHTIEALVVEASRAGVTMIQLREKTIPEREFVELANGIMQALSYLEASQGWRPMLIINDSLEVAMAAGADGLHLGQSDGSVMEARHRLGPSTILGLSVECMQDVERSAGAPVDYLGVSPVFSTPTKTDTKEPWGLEGLRSLSQRAERSERPLVAIGGLHAANAREVILAGADGIAVVSAICAADDPAEASTHLRAAIDAALLERKGGGHG